MGVEKRKKNRVGMNIWFIRYVPVIQLLSHSMLPDNNSNLRFVSGNKKC